MAIEDGKVPDEVFPVYRGGRLVGWRDGRGNPVGQFVPMAESPRVHQENGKIVVSGGSEEALRGPIRRRPKVRPPTAGRVRRRRK